MKKRLTAVVMMFAVFLTTAFAANAYQKSITVNYDVNLLINGSNPRLTDANGKTVQLFTYNGTTYVPIRAVAETMGAYVGYDSDTNTAIIFQDDIEAIALAHYIGEASHNLIYTLEEFFATCQLYNDGNITSLSAVSELQRLADKADAECSEVDSKYSVVVENENIYLDGINKCFDRLVDEYLDVAKAAESAANFVVSKNLDYLQDTP